LIELPLYTSLRGIINSFQLYIFRKLQLTRSNEFNDKASLKCVRRLQSHKML